MKASVIFLIDDDPCSVSVLVQLLRRRLTTVTIVPFTSPSAALSRLDEDRPWAVVTDLYMTEMTGSAVLDEVRKRRGDVPVVILSGLADPMTCAELLHAGALEIVTKTGDCAALTSVLALARRVHLLRRRLRAAQLRLHRRRLRAHTAEDLSGQTEGQPGESSSRASGRRRSSEQPERRVSAHAEETAIKDAEEQLEAAYVIGRMRTLRRVLVTR